ncbi:MAG: hypothetical protein AB7F76_05110 [Parvibaculaceae bacterium]
MHPCSKAVLIPVTPEGLGISQIPARATFTASHDMTVCVVEEAARMFELTDASARIAIGSGTQTTAGSLLMEAT